MSNNTNNDNLQKFRNIPIPNPDYDIESVKNYQGIKINEQGKKYIEKLVNIQSFGIKGVNYYHSSFNPPYYQSIPGSISELQVRKTVAKKLSIVNKKLNRIGLEIFVFDAFRPLIVQNYFYYQWVPQYLRSIYPNKNEAWIKKESKAYWSRGAQNKEELLKSIPPHLTGGAIDMTICFKETGHLLEMGSIFDDITERSHITYFESHLDIKSFTSVEALRNRRSLYHIMTKEGFASHPKEWWHFSYGDQMWALINKEQEAFYGYIDNDLKNSLDR